MPKYGIEQARFDKKRPSCVDSNDGPVRILLLEVNFSVEGTLGDNTKKKKKKARDKKEKRRGAFTTFTNLNVNFETWNR